MAACFDPIPSYLTAHVYFMLFLSLTCVAPPHPTIRDSLYPHWYEMVTVTWYAGLLLAECTNPGTRGGFSFVKTLNVICGVIAVAVHLAAIPMGEYYWSLMMYIRNQFMGVTLLMSCIQVS